MYQPIAGDIDPGPSSDKEENSGQISAISGDTVRKLHEANGKHATTTRKVSVLAATLVGLATCKDLSRSRHSLSNITVFRIWRERNPLLRWDLRQGFVASEVGEREYGRSADSISPRSFGRKFPGRGHPARL